MPLLLLQWSDYATVWKVNVSLDRYITIWRTRWLKGSVTRSGARREPLRYNISTAGLWRRDGLVLTYPGVSLPASARAVRLVHGGEDGAQTLSHFSASLRGAMRSMALHSDLAIDILIFVVASRNREGRLQAGRRANDAIGHAHSGFSHVIPAPDDATPFRERLARSGWAHYRYSGGLPKARNAPPRL